MVSDDLRHMIQLDLIHKVFFETELQEEEKKAAIRFPLQLKIDLMMARDLLNGSGKRFETIEHVTDYTLAGCDASFERRLSTSPTVNRTTINNQSKRQMKRL